MATRHWFGRRPADWTYTVGDGNTAVLQSETVTFWTQESGGVQQTDLLDAGGTAQTEVVTSSGSDLGSYPRFQGPPDVTSMWADAGGGVRFLMECTDLGDYASTIETTAAKVANVGVQYQGPTAPAEPAEGDIWFDTSQATSAEPVAFVASSGIDNPGSTPDTAVPLPDGLNPGHIMLLAACADVGGGAFLSTGPSGWTELIDPENIGSGDTFAGYWYKVYASGDTSPVITLSASKKCSAAIVAYSGANAIPDVIGTPGTRADGASTNLTTAPGVATDADDCVAVSLFVEKSSNTASITDPADTTRRAVRLPASGSGAPTVLIVDADAPTAGTTPDRTATYLTAAAAASTTDNGRGLQVALRRPA